VHHFWCTKKTDKPY